MRRNLGLLWHLEAVGFNDPQHHETKGGTGNADAGGARKVERKAAITNQVVGSVATKTNVCFGEGPNTNHEIAAQPLYCTDLFSGSVHDPARSTRSDTI
jgi:hypothetical protein